MPKQCHISTLASLPSVTHEILHVGSEGQWHMRYYPWHWKLQNAVSYNNAGNCPWLTCGENAENSESVKQQEFICHIPHILSTYCRIYHLRQRSSQRCSKVRKRCGVYEKWTLLHLSPSAPIFSGWNQTIPYNKIPSRTITLAHVCSQGGTKGEALRQALPSADSLS